MTIPMMRWLPPLLGVFAWTVAATAQAPYAPDPVTLLVVQDTSGGARLPWLNDLTRSPAGRFYLAVRGEPLVSMAPDGSAEAYLRRGDGTPVAGAELAWMGDTLALRVFRAWQLFAPGDQPVECRPFERMQSEFAVQVFERQPLPGGFTLGERRPPYPHEQAPDAFVVSRGQTIVRVLRERPSGPSRIDVPARWGGMWVSVVPPFAAQAQWAASDDGAQLVVVESAQPAAPGPHPVRLLRMDPGGRVLSDIHFTLPARPVTDTDRRAQLDLWAAQMSESTIPRDTAAAWRAFERTVPFPAFHPAVTDVEVGRDGTAWLRVGHEEGRAVWLRVSPDGGGEPLRVAVDSTFILAYVDADALWGSLRATDGSLRVVAYPLPGRPPLFRPGFAGFALPEPLATPPEIRLGC